MSKDMIYLYNTQECPQPCKENIGYPLQLDMSLTWSRKRPSHTN